MEIGATIRDYRKKRGLNQGQFAAKCGITQTTLSQIETDKKRPRKDTINRICFMLNISKPLLYVMSIRSHDVSEEKRELYYKFFPELRKMLQNIL